MKGQKWAKGALILPCAQMKFRDSANVVVTCDIYACIHLIVDMLLATNYLQLYKTVAGISITMNWLYFIYNCIFVSYVHHWHALRGLHLYFIHIYRFHPHMPSDIYIRIYKPMEKCRVWLWQNTSWLNISHGASPFFDVKYRIALMTDPSCMNNEKCIVRKGNPSTVEY